MVDYVKAEMLVRIADVPEMNPVQDKTPFFWTKASRADGYAREGDLVILEPTVAFIPEFDAFQDGTWIDLAFRNEGANVAIVILSDGVVPSYRQRLEPLQTIKVKHFKGAAAAPVLESLLGTKIRMFAWGVPFDGR